MIMIINEKRKKNKFTHWISLSPTIDGPGVISPSVKSLNGGVWKIPRTCCTPQANTNLSLDERYVFLPLGIERIGVFNGCVWFNVTYIL